MKLGNITRLINVIGREVKIVVMLGALLWLVAPSGSSAKERVPSPPEWWQEGMGYRVWWRQHDPHHPQCQAKGDYRYEGDYNEEEDSPIFKQQATEFLQKLQDSIRRNDKRAFAKLVSYPMRWNIVLGYYIYLSTPDQVVHHYHQIINKAMRKELLSASLEDIYPNTNRGTVDISVAYGRLWLQCEMKIYVVNAVRRQVLHAN